MTKLEKVDLVMALALVAGGLIVKWLMPQAMVPFWPAVLGGAICVWAAIQNPQDLWVVTDNATQSQRQQELAELEVEILAKQAMDPTRAAE